MEAEKDYRLFFRFDVPDRLSGLKCLQELNQRRKWNFIMVNHTTHHLSSFVECQGTFYKIPQVNVTLDEVNKMRYANSGRVCIIKVILQTKHMSLLSPGLYRSEVISQLVHPLNTVLDDSIGCALWFSSRGVGILYHPGSPPPGICYRLYQSSARVGAIMQGDSHSA